MSTPIYNKYSSIVPSEMSNNERRHMCMEIASAMYWNQEHAIVMLPHGNPCKVPVDTLSDYQDGYSPETGQIQRNERV